MAKKLTAAALEPDFYQAKVASYQQRKIMHAATGRNPKTTLCGYQIDQKDRLREFTSTVDNACQRCLHIVENRVNHEW